MLLKVFLSNNILQITDPLIARPLSESPYFLGQGIPPYYNYYCHAHLTESSSRYSFLTSLAITQSCAKIYLPDNV